MAPETYAGLKALYRAALDGQRGQLEQNSPEGDRCFSVVGKPLVDETGEVRAGLALAQDITDLRAGENDLRASAERLTLAERDDLTQLPSRGLVRDRLERALTRAERRPLPSAAAKCASIAITRLMIASSCPSRNRFGCRGCAHDSPTKTTSDEAGRDSHRAKRWRDAQTAAFRPAWEAPVLLSAGR